MPKYDKLITEAARRTGHREMLVQPVVDIILNRHSRGQAVDSIVGWLRENIGPDNAAAQPEFVRWVITAARR